MHNSPLGKLGEELAGCFLIKKGYQIIEYNWRSEKLEVDVVAKRQNLTCLIEVKTRTDNIYGSAVDQLTKNKVKNLKRAAVKYSIKHKIPLKNINLEFIAIDISSKDKKAKIKHFLDII